MFKYNYFCFVFFVFWFIFISIWEENEYIKPKKKFLSQEEDGLLNIIIKIKKNVVKNEWKDIMRKLTTDEFIEKAKKVHGDKYDYSKISYTSFKHKICIICPLHGEFYQRPYNHLRWGCSKCSGVNKSNTKEFIKKSQKIHGNKYNYSKINYTNNREKVKIICLIHGEFSQPPHDHLIGCGCPTCGIENQKKLMKSNTEEFIYKSKKVHGDKYDYSKVNYKKSNKKVEIVCLKHGSFFQKPNGHLDGKGCIKCCKIISKRETEFLNYLNVPNTSTNRQKKLLGFNVDGIDYDTKTIYEFLGDYWHGNPKIYNKNDINKATKTTFGELYQNTFKKFKKLKNHGYNIKYIWEYDWDKWNNNRSKNIPIIKY